MSSNDFTEKAQSAANKYQEFISLQKIKCILLSDWSTTLTSIKAESRVHCREILGILKQDNPRPKLVDFLNAVAPLYEGLKVEECANELLEIINANEDYNIDVGEIANFMENNELVKFFDTEEQRRRSHTYRVLDLFKVKNHPLSDSERSVSISMEGDSVVLTCKTSMKRFLEMIEPNNDLNAPLSIRLSGR